MDIQTETEINPRKRKRTFAYLGIVAVVFVWGLYPVFTSDLLGTYSGGAFTLASSLVSAVVLLPECLPKLKYIDRSYFKVAIPTGFVVGAANLLQKIGLTYTTPTRYAFLENLSCVVVPILLFLFIRKKPHPLTVLGSVLCLAGCFIMSGVSDEGVSVGVGEILCALAGVFYGVNIAATGVFAVRMNAMLYVMIQMWVNVAVSGIAAFALDRITVGGEPIERFVFSWEWRHLLAVAVLVLAISTFGWIVRTEALKYVNAAVVAVIMPFSSVVTGIFAVLAGKDTFALPLLFGGLIILLSSVLSSVADIRESKRKYEHLKEPIDDD